LEQHTIPADPGRLKEARDFAEAAATRFGLDPNARYRVKLAMNEAVANAIQHGSESPSDRVELAALREGGAVAFYVRDGGRFVPRVGARGDLPERGRGLEFMDRLMDEVEVRPGHDGTVVRLALRAAA